MKAIVEVEVLAGNSEIKPQTKKDGTANGFKQEVYACLGSAYPEQTYIRVEAPLSPGIYNIEYKLKVGKYRDIEIAPFEAPEIKSVKPPVQKAN